MPFPTTGGTKFLGIERKVAQDSSIVKNLRKLGALLIGRSLTSSLSLSLSLSLVLSLELLSVYLLYGLASLFLRSIEWVVFGSVQTIERCE